MTTVEPIRNRADLKKIETLLARQSPRNLLFFLIGTNCGLRISDILKLNITDVKNKTQIEIIEQKTGKLKRFPINAKLKPLLKSHTKNKPLTAPLFTTRFNNRLDRVQAYRIIKDACKQAKIEEKIGTHTLRKTFGYHHYQRFKDVVMLQKIFNHSSPEVTLRYIGIEQEKINQSYLDFIL